MWTARSKDFKLYAASFVTALIAAGMLTSEAYIGTQYSWSEVPQEIMGFVVGIVLWTIPAALFALFLVWPLSLFAAGLCERIDPKARWLSWLATGALLGVPAMWIYSFFLGLGHDLYIALSLNGALLGVICAAFSRWFLTPQIHDAAGREAE